MDIELLPSLVTVLSSVKEEWEQLGLQLDIDPSVLVDIKGKGGSEEQMECLLEQWSLKEDTFKLKQLEDALRHIGKENVISGMLIYYSI